MYNGYSTIRSDSIFFDDMNNVYVAMTTSNTWNVIKFATATLPNRTSFNLIMNSNDTQAVAIGSMTTLYDVVFVGGISKYN